MIDLTVKIQAHKQITKLLNVTLLFTLNSGRSIKVTVSGTRSACFVALAISAVFLYLLFNSMFTWKLRVLVFEFNKCQRPNLIELKHILTVTLNVLLNLRWKSGGSILFCSTQMNH